MTAPPREPSLTFATCPKCRHTRTPGERADPGVCPACGLVFAKWIRQASFVSPSRQRREARDVDVDAGDSLFGRCYAALGYVPEQVEPLHWWGRALAWLLVAIWGWRLAGLDYTVGEMGASFMHAILLPIHEAGHMLFMPLGEFMTIAGGSLFQLLLPLICAGALLHTNRDPFGAALGLLWCGSSLVDLAPYIYDAKHPQLILLGGHTGEDGPHDWIYLLDQFGKVAHSPAYGTFAHHLGVMLMVGALAWGAGILWRQRQRWAGAGPGER
ncbi:MAG: zinc ribbon domain-containing protein [Rhodocyclaceae bacterium]|nr:MAG: zinc ribbon domain-containing protein [Rhodocyclaceae bacterium]